MIGCTETITLVRHVLDDEDDRYICHTVKNNASWFAKTTITTSGDGAKPSNTYDIRVFDALTGSEPAEGDFCVRGEINSVTAPADLKETEHFRITAIGHNVRCPLPHWRLSGQ